MNAAAHWLNRGGLLRLRPMIIVGTLLLLAALLAACLSGCGAGQRVLSAQATVHRAHQAERFGWYRSQHVDCVEAHPEDRASYRACMAPARHVARAADSYRAALEGAQAALDAAGEDGFAAMLPGLVRAADRLVVALVAAGVPVPQVVRDVVALGDEL